MTTCSSIWIIYRQGTKKQCVDVFKMYTSSYEFSNNLVELPDTRNNYCVCSFMKNLYVIGGRVKYESKRTCLKYSTRNSKWYNKASLYNPRFFASCTVFEGKIVVSGGISDNWKASKSVEAYDLHENKWNNLPNMINERAGHGAVSMGNKMFVIGGVHRNNTCEVFDSISRTFTAIKKVEVVGRDWLSAVGIGNKILAFPNLDQCTIKSAQVYDVVKDQWFEKVINLFEVNYVISSSKLPVV